MGGPPTTKEVANSVYTPTTGDRYVKPREKFSHFDMVAIEMRHITQGFQLLGVLIYAPAGIVGHPVVSLKTYA